MKPILLPFFFTLLSFASQAQSLQVGAYTGISCYRNLFNVAPDEEINRWDNNIFVRWEPKGKFGFELAFNSFVRTSYGEGGGWADYGYNAFSFYERNKGIYNDYQFTLRSQYRLFHSQNNRFTCYAGISFMIYYEASSAYSWYYVPDTTHLTNTTANRYKLAHVWGGINAKASYKIGKHYNINALLQCQKYFFGLTDTKLADPITYVFYGNGMMTCQLGLSYSFSYN